MERTLQEMEEDIRKLEQMNQLLFDSWQDKMSEHFEKGCVGKMLQIWKDYRKNIEPLIQRLNKYEQDLQGLSEKINKLK